MLYRLAYRFPDGTEDHGEPIEIEVAEGWVDHYRKHPCFGLIHWVEESEDGAEWRRRSSRWIGATDAKPVSED